MGVSGIGTIGYPMVGYETKSTENNVSENQFMDTLLETESTNKNAHAEKESKKQIKISDDTKYSHRYTFVATSLPETYTAENILAIYRLRWQVEMVFKRYKSILGAGSVPVKTKEAAEAWINGKMMPALLIEKFIGSVDFSPSGENIEKQEHMEGNQTGISVNFYSYHAKN